MDISQLLSLFNQNQPNSQNLPTQQQNNIPKDVLNSYPTTYIDSPTNHTTKIQNTPLNNQYQPQNPINMLSSILPTLFKGNFDISGLINALGGGKTNILSNLLTNKKIKSKPKTGQQKNSPKYDEFKKVEDYEFSD